MNEVILHHYPASPVSEKVRVALGIKGLRGARSKSRECHPNPT